MPISNFEEFSRIELSDGEVVHLYADTERLKEELLRIAPEDEKMIKKFTKDMRIIARLKTPVNLESQTMKEKIKSLRINIRPLLKMLKYLGMSAEDFFLKWKSPRLVEEIDISTPYTVQRYTGNWHGSFEGFAPTPETMKRRVPKEIPGLANFYMIGQWTEPGGGLPPAGLHGRSLASELCKRDGKKFSGDYQPQISSLKDESDLPYI